MAFVGSFLGFTYSLDDGTTKHSKDLGIVRVSDGDRFNDGLTPSFKDRTSTVNGADRTYYFGADYTTKTFAINFAFEKLTEANLRQLRQIFGSKTIHKLVFDETPYKAYWVKPQTAPSLKYVPIDEGCSSGETITDLYGQGSALTSRWYNGEGTISFIAYEPFAQSTYKFLNQITIARNDLNVNEWNKGISLKNSTDTDTAGTHIIDTFNATDKKFYVYNPGDFDTDFKLYFRFPNSTTQPASLKIQYNSSTTQYLELKTFTLQGSGTAGSPADNGIVIDTKLHIVQGCYFDNTTVTETGRIYNQYINSGDFFKIPVSTSDNYIILTTTDTLSSATIDYKYLFY